MRKIISKLYRELLPKKVQKVVRPFIDRVFIFVHRLSSIYADIYQPVSILKGKGSQNGINLSFLIAGKGQDSAFLLNKIYPAEPEATKIKRMFIWKIPFFKPEVNATLIEADRCFSRFLAHQGFFAIPAWISFIMDISIPMEKIVRRNNGKGNSANFRKISKYSYEYEVGSNEEKLHLFYHTMYLPYISARHGKLMVHTTLNRMKDILQKGELLLIKRSGEYVSGQLIYKTSPIPIVSYLGVKDGNIDLVKQGALYAVYYYTILWAKEKGYTKLDFGHCRPFLNDGVFLFKRSFGMKIQRSPQYRRLYLSISSLNSYLEQFFANNPLVHETQGVLKGLLFLKKDVPSVKEVVEVSSRKYFIPGLAGFTVVLPDGTKIETA